MRAAFVFSGSWCMSNSNRAETCIMITNSIPTPINTAARILTFIARRPKRPYGKNLPCLLTALRFAPGNRFPSLRAWYQSPHAIGGSRESRRQSCWSVIHHGWAIAVRSSRGSWECTLTQTGLDVVEGRLPIRKRKPGIVIPFSPDYVSRRAQAVKTIIRTTLKNNGRRNAEHDRR